MDLDARRSRHAVPNACRSDPAGALRAPLPRGRADGRSADGSSRDLATGRLEASRPSRPNRTSALPPSRTPDALSRRGARLEPADRLDGTDERVLGEPVRRPRRPAQKDGPMSEQLAPARSIVGARVMLHPPEKIWRALTEAHLIEQWLMRNDFEPRLGAQFTFRAKPMGDWDGTVRCEVTAFDPPRRLAYSWKGGSVSNSTYCSTLDSVVEWLLSPEPGGTRVRMEHSGFAPGNEMAFEAMSSGWPRGLERLQQVAAGA